MKIYLYSLLALMGGLTSCASLDVFTFDQLSPAKVNYPAEVQRVAVINAVPDASASTKGVVTIGELRASGKPVAEMVANNLADSKYFSEVMISDSLIRPVNLAGGFSDAEIQRLAVDMGVDLIMALCDVKVLTQRKEMFYPGMPMSLPVVRMKVRPEMKLYIPGRSYPVQVLTPIDSIDWDVQALVSDKQLQDEAIPMTAHLLGRELVPYWKEANRLYYSGGSVEMRDANVYIKENDWGGACREWEKLYQKSKSGKQKFRAAFNLVLGNEMQNRLDEALQWLQKAAHETKPDTEEAQAVKIYKEQLSSRIKEQMFLNSQMSRFGNNF